MSAMRWPARAREWAPENANEWRLVGSVAVGGALFTVVTLGIALAIGFSMSHARLLDGGEAFWTLVLTLVSLGMILSLLLRFGAKRTWALFSVWLAGYVLLWTVGVAVEGMPFWLFLVGWGAIALGGLQLARGDRGLLGRSLRAVVPGAPETPWRAQTGSKALARRLRDNPAGLVHGRLAPATVALIADLIVQATEIIEAERARLPGSVAEFASERLLSCLLRTWHAQGRRKRLAPSEVAYFKQALAVAVEAAGALDRAEDQAVFRAVFGALIAAWYTHQPTFHPA